MIDNNEIVRVLRAAREYVVDGCDPAWAINEVCGKGPGADALYAAAMEAFDTARAPTAVIDALIAKLTPNIVRDQIVAQLLYMNDWMIWAKKAIELGDSYICLSSLRSYGGSDPRVVAFNEQNPEPQPPPATNRPAWTHSEVATQYQALRDAVQLLIDRMQASIAEHRADEVGKRFCEEFGCSSVDNYRKTLQDALDAAAR